MILIDLERRNGRYYFTEFRFEANYVKVVELRPILSATKIYPAESSFHKYIIYGDILIDYWKKTVL